MKKLLVAFDGSNSAVRALRHAIAVAQEHPSVSIHLVVAYEDPIYTDTAVSFPYEAFVEMEVARGAKVLERGVKLLTEAGVPYATEILRGPIASTIAERAEALRCDSIVMGTRGMTAFKNLVLGSVATKVIHASQLPVTLVK